MKTIWVSPGVEIESPAAESNPRDYATEFVKTVSHEIACALQICFGERNIFENLLYSLLCERGIKGLLEQYENSRLEIIARDIRREFALPEHIRPNYNNATHAKFAPLIRAIIEQYIEDK